jgi:geranylgeranyl diphosphate synthase type I
MSQQEIEDFGSFSDHLALIEAELEEIVRSAQESQALYYGMMRYHLGWADASLCPTSAAIGKRLRPLLCLLCCESAGGNPRDALPAAAAVELVHNFSLVHDDIQDQSRVRRGRRAVWDIWGAAHGINVGDGLFVLARLALYRLAERRVVLARQQAAFRALDEACLALCEGQFLDMAFEDRQQVSLQEYLQMIQRKTAALLATSSQLGAIVTTDDVQVVSAYRHFGESLGMAFQIQDDILGIWGDERVTGKSTATDIRDRKKTLPVVYALEQAQHSSAVGELAELYAKPGSLGPSEIESVLAVLERIGARQYAEERTEEYTDLALMHLDGLGLENAAASLLRALASSLHSRNA